MRTFGRHLVALLVLAVVVMAPAPATAHAALESSDPAEGTTLDALPQTVSVTLTEDVAEPAVLRVLDPAGERVDDGDVSVAGRRVLVGVLADEAPAGEYRTVYRVVSADGHAVTGEVPFTLEADSSAAAPSASPSAQPSEGTDAQPAPSATPTPSDVRVTEIEDGEESRWAPFWILGFLVITSGVLLYIVKAGLGSNDEE